MCRIASLFLLQRPKRSMSGNVRDFNNIETLAVIMFFFFVCVQGKAPKEIHAILTETFGEHAPSYVTVKNWVVPFKRGVFSTCDAPRPRRPKTVTTPEVIDQIDAILWCHHFSALLDINVQPHSRKLAAGPPVGHAPQFGKRCINV